MVYTTPASSNSGLASSFQIPSHGDAFPLLNYVGHMAVKTAAEERVVVPGIAGDMVVDVGNVPLADDDLEEATGEEEEGALPCEEAEAHGEASFAAAYFVSAHFAFVA
jgi:hypothetical protein